MRHEHSYGVVPLRRREGKWELFLIQHRAGNYWGFPKGHAESGEEPQMAARRELREEISLVISKFLSDVTFDECYSFVRNGEQITKKVIYFLAEVEGKAALQEIEILDAKWVPLSEAVAQLTFPQSKQICRKVMEFLQINAFILPPIVRR